LSEAFFFSTLESERQNTKNKTMLSLDTSAVPKKKKKFSLKEGQNLLIVVLVVLLCGALVGMGYVYYAFVLHADKEVKSEEELLRETVGSKILLPEEVPQIATVTDKTQLADQPFFKKAENGDKILIFTQSGRAVLYRPRIKKVVDTTTISLTPEVSDNTATGTTPDPNATPTDSAEAAGVTEPTERLNIAIYNGSEKIGITNTFDDDLKAMYQNIDVVLKETAKRSDYPKSIVVDLTERNGAFAKELATKIKSEVGKLPEGETVPENTDILIILGNNDYKSVP
jgi:cytoskeletal protein RodZ